MLAENKINIAHDFNVYLKVNFEKKNCNSVNLNYTSIKFIHYITLR